MKISYRKLELVGILDGYNLYFRVEFLPFKFKDKCPDAFYDLNFYD